MADKNGRQREKHTVLVTGAAGAVGQPVVKELQARGHRVRGLDLRPTPGVDDSHVGSIADPDVLDRAVAGVTAIVHLAAVTDDADFVTKLVPNNILAIHYLFEAAVKHGVKRVVLASTMQTISGRRHMKDPPAVIPPTLRAPVNGYAVSKCFAEDMGFMYAANRQMAVVCARIGFLPRTPAEARRFVDRPGLQDIYLSHDDAGRFFGDAVEAPGVTYAVLWATSRRERAEGCDLGPSRQVIGYEPRDRFPEGLGFAFDASAADATV